MKSALFGLSYLIAYFSLSFFFFVYVTKWTLQDIVTESATFDLVGFIPVLREKLYCNSHWAQTLVVSWVSVLHTVPDVDTLSFLSEILDGLFFILEAPKAEVKKM